MIRKAYANLPCGDDNADSWQIHYREMGEGDPVVLLHPSALSSAFMEPLISLFGKQARAIAPDTPGYGQSDSLPCEEEGLAPYVKALHDFITELGIKKPVIYGSATGAQIAIEYGKAYPQQTRGLLLENVAWFFDDEREVIMQSYFLDISPQRDGSHLQLVWKMVSQLYRYFPWYDTSEAALVNKAEVPLEIQQKTMLDYFIAGTDYHRAYLAAFMNERPEQLQQLKVPTRIMRWQGSLIKKYMDRLDDVELPGNIEMCFVDSGIEARFAELERSLKALL